MIGIYQIVNKQNDRKYVGKSSNLFNRLNTHISDLIGNRHTNIILQKDFNKYGYNGFMFEILDICSIEDMGKLESYYIKLLDSENDYNVLGLRNNEQRKTKASYKHNKHSELVGIARTIDQYIVISYNQDELIKAKEIKDKFGIEKQRKWAKIIDLLETATITNGRLRRK
ncbi:MAG: GIY-YIG nuclease family protein [Clostridiales bacterium]